MRSMVEGSKSAVGTAPWERPFKMCAERVGFAAR
jgi:hypothetical protein